ncbi:hypothetical protein HDE_04058 [Halotydeus destructor]|nr:hypothetical protein HDE_04058 [Halotydeus destructor]
MNKSALVIGLAVFLPVLIHASCNTFVYDDHQDKETTPPLRQEANNGTTSPKPQATPVTIYAVVCLIFAIFTTICCYFTLKTGPPPIEDEMDKPYAFPVNRIKINESNESSGSSKSPGHESKQPPVATDVTTTNITQANIIPESTSVPIEPINNTSVKPLVTGSIIRSDGVELHPEVKSDGKIESLDAK